MSEPEIVRGPVIDSGGTITYEITLASGMIVTSPSGFGKPAPEAEALGPNRPIVTPDGRVLLPKPRQA